MFTQRYGNDALDASLLLVPLVRFLPSDDPRVRATVLAIADELTEDGLVLRYRVEETDDGLSGEEGAFTICSFWLVSALVEIGEVSRARHLCEKLLSFASPLHLYAEEIEAEHRTPPRNFPQAFTHLALINAVVHVIRAEEQADGTGVFQPANSPLTAAPRSILSQPARSALSCISRTRLTARPAATRRDASTSVTATSASTMQSSATPRACSVGKAGSRPVSPLRTVADRTPRSTRTSVTVPPGRPGSELNGHRGARTGPPLTDEGIEKPGGLGVGGQPHHPGVSAGHRQTLTEAGEVPQADAGHGRIAIDRAHQRGGRTEAVRRAHLGAGTDPVGQQLDRAHRGRGGRVQAVSTAWSTCSGVGSTCCSGVGGPGAGHRPVRRHSR